MTDPGRFPESTRELRQRKPRSRLRMVSQSQRVKQAQWRKVTKQAILAVGGMCQVRAPGCTRQATDGHHKLGRAVGGPNTLENCCVCCRSCHCFLATHRAWAIEMGFIIERRSLAQGEL